MTTQLRTSSRKAAINYVGPLVVYGIVDPHNYLLMTIDGKMLRGLFEHERLKPAMIRSDKGNVNTLLAIKKSHELRNIHLTYLTQPCHQLNNPKTSMFPYPRELKLLAAGKRNNKAKASRYKYYSCAVQNYFNMHLFPQEHHQEKVNKRLDKKIKKNLCDQEAVT